MLCRLIVCNAGYVTPGYRAVITDLKRDRKKWATSLAREKKKLTSRLGLTIVRL